MLCWLYEDIAAVSLLRSRYIDARRPGVHNDDDTELGSV